MVVGIGHIKFRLYDVHSLKAKRSIVKSVISKLQNRFNISVAETDLNDSHDWAQIGFAMVGNDARIINSKVGFFSAPTNQCGVPVANAEVRQRAFCARSNMRPESIARGH